jgi:hypothetical protein
MFKRTGNYLGVVLPACVFLGVAFAPRHVAAEDAVERLRREAIGLFRQAVLPSQPMPPRCGLRKEWLNDSIPEDIGRRYFGLAVHANLTSPDHATRPDEVIDPDGRMPEAFCTNDEAKQERNRLVPGTMEAQPGGAACNAPVEFHQKYTKYSFPVFSADYRRAAIVISHTDIFWIDAKYCGIDADWTALVYARRGAGWRLIASELLGAT